LRTSTLVSHAPSVRLLPLLKRLLDDNLRRYRAFREEARAAGWRHGDAINELHAPLSDLSPSELRQIARVMPSSICATCFATFTKHAPHKNVSARS
jgi:hypothetical protein